MNTLFATPIEYSENLRVMSIGFICPHCGKRSNIFAGHGGEQMAEDFHVPFLGCIPIDPKLSAASDRGRRFVTLAPESPTAQALRHAFEPLLAT